MEIRTNSLSIIIDNPRVHSFIYALFAPKAHYWGSQLELKGKLTLW